MPPTFWAATWVINSPDWTRLYKNITMPIFVEIGMLITSYFVIKND